ncbi:MAG: AAA family ATPase [Oscillospiraceae bacterium]|nr:AAA family ATPase [Oscillospiraceae bacterium]
MGGFGLLGERLTHSFSPFIHAELGGYEYCLYEKKPDELDEFLKHGGFDGLNVTIPYKKAVIPYCGILSETARATGSVNTLTRLPGGNLYGDNTDFFGFSYLLKQAGVNPADGKTVILGSGGSSLTVHAVLRDMNAKEITVVSRHGANNYANIDRHRDAVMIVNTTPVGMYPNNGISPIANIDAFENCRAVIDLIYNPARTELLLQAQERGMLTVNGLAMLVAQAKKSAESFVNKTIPDGQIEIITAKLARKARNIILIGMPGCGKTSIGMALAKKMGREFADTDELIVQSANKTIPAIFAGDGEDAFRAWETNILGAVCKRSGLIIATGGGVVTRHENLNLMRQNGTVVFLDRDIGELPVSGRPLSLQNGIHALAENRLPLYRQWSEHTAPVCGVEQTAQNISEWFCGGAAL